MSTAIFSQRVRTYRFASGTDPAGFPATSYGFIGEWDGQILLKTSKEFDATGKATYRMDGVATFSDTVVVDQRGVIKDVASGQILKVIGILPRPLIGEIQVNVAAIDEAQATYNLTGDPP